MTTASKITLVRVVLIPVYMVLMLLSANGADWLRWAAVAVFVIASISDFLDGYIARHYNQVSDFGKFLDPLADKLLVTACMMIFVGWGRMPSWVCLLYTSIVDVNIRRLRIKIEDDTANPTYITTVWGFGYKWGA